MVLVNNAGVTRDNLLLRMKEEEWQTVFDTNVGALYRLCKPLLRPMTKARWGRIINLSSVVGRMGKPWTIQLCRIKGGRRGVYQSARLGDRIAIDYRQRGRAGIH